MCGIAGIVCKKEDSEAHIERFKQSAELMNHRGPDHRDEFRFENTLLIHYRLSIIDLDKRSNQPFESQSGQNVTVYNGEIYNYQKLGSELKCQLRTNSDTEVMVEGFEEHGYEVVAQWNGIFSLAMLETQQKKLSLIRDRFGVKPLYYYEDDDVFLFSSEAKVIFDWLPTLSLSIQGLGEYLWYGNTTGEQTMVEKVKKLEPATIFEIDLANAHKKKTRFWTNPGTRKKVPKKSELVGTITDLLTNAVSRQLVSDVPLGILLSGGIDSSAIVATASMQSGTKIDTYSVEYDYNIGGESELARAAMVAKKYKTNHHEFKITSNDVPEIFKSLVFQYDEPFADSANVPLFQLTKLCGEDKKVVLQGDGGDELFAGYRRYNVMEWMNFWRYAASVSYRFITNARWRERMKRISFVLNQKDNGLRMAYLLTENVPYEDPYSILSDNMHIRAKGTNPFESYQLSNQKYSDEDIVQRLLYTDMDIILPNTYLEKVDKASMMNSVEARVPFLDNELTEYVLGLPSEFKVKKGQKKYLLRKALKGIVPDHILNGHKRGFDVPYKKWLKDDLYDFAYATFETLGPDSILNTRYLQNLLIENKKGKVDHGPILWKALVLSTWLGMYKSKIVP